MVKARPQQAALRKPPWIRIKAPTAKGFGAKGFGETQKTMREHNLHTVCEAASCPNMGECWSRRHATVMILGDVCTRACAFCKMAARTGKTGKPSLVDPMEPGNLALGAAKMGLKHIVITSVNRDDLNDGGALQFARCIERLRAMSPNTTIEVLIPDFRGKEGALETVMAAAPDVLNHNLETVLRLYPRIRQGARYDHSLHVLRLAKELNPQIFTKSGLMVGLGEDRSEMLQAMDDLLAAKVDFLTIGQYLQPSQNHAAVERFVAPEEFDEYKQIAMNKGFLLAAASPFTRSSYHADRDFALLRAARLAKI